METYANVLLYGTLAFMVLIIIEAIFAYFKGNFNFTSMDTISSLSAGMTNLLKSLFGLTIIILSYDFMYEHFALIHIESSVLVMILAFVALDFGSYWHHRLAHHVNIFWNRHVIHHSGEEFNLATALRQSISKFVSMNFIFLLPAALLGLPPEIIKILTPIHLYLQFWYHTEHIGKLGFLEYIIVTPSQHRVHHATNLIYLDKNLGGIFCIWDRIFGTFQEELEEEPCVYGITRPVKTWNPIVINFIHLWLLIQDAWRTKNLWDKCRIWFMPTGWRPEDVKEKYPVSSVLPHELVKYDTKPSLGLKIWSWTQFLVLMMMVFHMMTNVAKIPPNDLFLYGGFLFLMIYSYTTLMDKAPYALWLEAIKSAMALSIIYITGDWFLIENVLPNGVFVVAAFQVISVLAVGYFVKNEVNTNSNVTSEASFS
jgi:alkylglycerol monooxygenase